MSECLDANAVQDLMSGALEASMRERVFAHLDGCADCRDLIGVLARESVLHSAEEALHKRATALATTDGFDAPGTAATESATIDPGASAALAQTLVSIERKAPELRRLGRYQLSERIGSGAMGVVYRALDQELARDVALKLLKRPDASLTDRLMREARSMAQVNHPNVVGVYDVGVADGATYIAMELVSGESLRSWQSAAPRTIPEIVEAYVAAGRGLAAAHAAGIIHRDFKPDNVLIGSDGRIRVTDFGLAAANATSGGNGSGDAITDVDLTASGSVLGTPAYMAPEQFTGGNVDPRTDQFNYCVSLYEALYRHRPFSGKSFEELGNAVCDGKIKPSPAGSPVSTALRGILVRGLSLRPGDRFPTMDDLLVELGRDRARPWRRAAIASGAVALALAFGLGADWMIRDRVESQIHDAFEATGVQVGRAVDLLSKNFVVASNVAYLQPQIKDVSGHYDAADFGLGTTDEDTKKLDELHEILSSADWDSWTRDLDPGPLAISDRKGRLLYTSTAPDVWGGDLTGLAMVKHLIEGGKDDTATEVLRADATALRDSKLLGERGGGADLWVMFARAFAPQDKLGALYLQFSSGDKLLADIRLDADTLLALVGSDGTYVPVTMPRALVVAARPDEVREVHDGGQSYQVLAKPILDKGKPIANVVMARRLGGVLSGLFPGARTVFAIATALALAIALVTALRARRLTGGSRVGAG